MGRAGLVFEPHPSTFQNLHNFWRCFNDIAWIFFHITVSLRFPKNPKRVLCPVIGEFMDRQTLSWMSLNQNSLSTIIWVFFGAFYNAIDTLLVFKTNHLLSHSSLGILAKFPKRLDKKLLSLDRWFWQKTANKIVSACV